MLLTGTGVEVVDYLRRFFLKTTIYKEFFVYCSILR